MSDLSKDSSKKVINPAFMVACVDLHHVDFIANNFIQSARLLLEQKDGSHHGQSFQLLVSVAFELLPKIVLAGNVCLLHQNDKHLSEAEIREEITRALMKPGHNLKKIFEGLPTIMEKTGIESISKVPDKSDEKLLINEYRFKVTGCDYLLSVKDVEAVRYGTFSQQRDVLLDTTGDDEIMELLLKLQNVVREKTRETVNHLRELSRA